MSLDPVALTQDLIRRPSVTPADEGAMDIVERTLAELGFVCRRMKFGEIENLYARYGAARPNLCFAGHTDVVPVGDAAAWSQGAFEAAEVDGVLIGRGAVDMKSAIAAFAAWLVILFNVAYGVMNARRTRVLAARIMGASGPRIMRDVLVWESLQPSFVGLRSAVSMALVIVIVAEMFIGADSGLGNRIINSQQVLNVKSMYASILAAGALGYALNVLFLVAEKRIVHWSGR